MKRFLLTALILVAGYSSAQEKKIYYKRAFDGLEFGFSVPVIQSAENEGFYYAGSISQEAAYAGIYAHYKIARNARLRYLKECNDKVEVVDNTPSKCHHKLEPGMVSLGCWLDADSNKAKAKAKNARCRLAKSSNNMKDFFDDCFDREKFFCGNGVFGVIFPARVDGLYSIDKNKNMTVYDHKLCSEIKSKIPGANFKCE